MDDPPRYHHRQIGYAAILTLLLAGLWQLAANADRNAGRRRSRLSQPAVLLLAASLAMISSLTTEVGDDALSAWFSFGLFRRRIPLIDILDASVVHLPWYAGWGLRYLGGGPLYRVWGRRGVRLSLAGGREFTIGSDEPELLRAAIEEARAAHSIFAGPGARAAAGDATSADPSAE